MVSSAAGHEDEATGRKRPRLGGSQVDVRVARCPTSPDPVSGPAVVGRLTCSDLLVCSRCVLLCPDDLTSDGLDTADIGLSVAIRSTSTARWMSA
jgi:hypothetical protein